MLLAPVFNVEKFEVNGGAIVAGKLHFVLETFRLIEDVAFIQVVEDLLKFVAAELNVVVFSSWVLRLAWRSEALLMMTGS